MIVKVVLRLLCYILRNKRLLWFEVGFVVEGLGVGKEDNIIVVKYENW